MDGDVGVQHGCAHHQPAHVSFRGLVVGHAEQLLDLAEREGAVTEDVRRRPLAVPPEASLRPHEDPRELSDIRDDADQMFVRPRRDVAGNGIEGPRLVPPDRGQPSLEPFKACGHTRRRRLPGLHAPGARHGDQDGEKWRSHRSVTA